MTPAARIRLAVARALLRGTGWQAASTTLLDATADLLEQYEQDARKRRRMLCRLWAKRRNPWTMYGNRLLCWADASRGVYVSSDVTAPPAAYQPSTVCDLSGKGED